MMKPSPYAIYLNIRKHIPTDMDWHPTMNGGYVSVRFSISADWSIGLDFLKTRPHWQITIGGGDDTQLQVWDLTYEEGLEIFHSLKYIQSPKDLKVFEPVGDYIPGVGYKNYMGKPIDCNGYPSERPCFTGQYLQDQEVTETDEYFDGRTCEWYW